MIETMCAKLVPAGIPFFAATISASINGDPDMFVAVGASLATALAAFEAREKQVGWKDFFGSIVVSFFGGITIPGIISSNPSLRSAVEKLTGGHLSSDWTNLTWHSWALFGFLVGTFSLGVYKLIKIRVDKFFAKRLETTEE